MNQKPFGWRPSDLTKPSTAESDIEGLVVQLVRDRQWAFSGVRSFGGARQTPTVTRSTVQQTAIGPPALPAGSKYHEVVDRSWAVVWLVAGCTFAPPTATFTDADPIDGELPSKDALDPIDASSIDGEEDAAEPIDASIDAADDAEPDAEQIDAEPEDALPIDAGEPPEIPHLAPEERTTNTDP